MQTTKMTGFAAKWRVVQQRAGQFRARTWEIRCAIVGVLLTIVCTDGSVSAADVYVGPSIAASSRQPLAELSHEKLDDLLRKYVDERGMVNYTAWKASAEDQRTLDAYIAQLAAVRLSGTRQELLAYWINAYNAVTIKGILREYPTDSIRNHTAKFFGYNIWKNLKLRVDGRAYSLDDMEHKVLRKLKEPRIHFAIVCASIGCPRLLNEAYLAERLDEQLTMNAKHFFADREKFRWDASAKRVYLSPILSWFGEDFGDSQRKQLQTIAPWVPASAQPALRSGNAKISFLDYDWGLNDRKR